MQPPAMTADQVAEHPSATVRVNCRTHGVCLYAGDADPEGGADAVWAAAGCPAADADQGGLDACPNRVEPPEQPTSPLGWSPDNTAETS